VVEEQETGIREQGVVALVFLMLAKGLPDWAALFCLYAVHD
jgi:hypothetical protein